MLDELKSAIRRRLWAALGPPNGTSETPVPGPQSAPLGIDRGRNLPLHYEPPECPLCVFAEFQCHDCLGSILDAEAPFGVGFESATITHMHIHAMVGRDGGGRSLRVPARRKLCVKCFRLDWERAHPGIPCDV